MTGSPSNLRCAIAHPGIPGFRGESLDSGSTPCGASRNDAHASLRKPIRPALLDRALESGARVHARQPCAQIRIGCELVEYFRHLADKAHLDIGAGQRVPDEELAAL